MVVSQSNGSSRIHAGLLTLAVQPLALRTAPAGSRAPAAWILTVFVKGRTSSVCGQSLDHMGDNVYPPVDARSVVSVLLSGLLRDPSEASFPSGSFGSLCESVVSPPIGGLGFLCLFRRPAWISRVPGPAGLPSRWGCRLRFLRARPGIKAQPARFLPSSEGLGLPHPFRVMRYRIHSLCGIGITSFLRSPGPCLCSVPSR